jgi:ribosomal protein S18 acetylase RimI-like enzyme
MGFRKPVPLNDTHEIAGFDCGKTPLNAWLADMARYNQAQGYTRTFVIADEHFRVVGYHSLCAGMISRNDVSRAIKGGQAPQDIPVALLARLAVDVGSQGKGLGPALLSHALRSAVSAGQSVAFRAVMVDALDDDAMRFYKKYGFEASRISPSKLLLPMRKVLASLDEATQSS